MRTCTHGSFYMTKRWLWMTMMTMMMIMIISITYDEKIALHLDDDGGEKFMII